MTQTLSGGIEALRAATSGPAIVPSEAVTVRTGAKTGFIIVNHNEILAG